MLYNEIIKHKNNIDICYHVCKSYDIGTDLVLKLDIVNMGFVDSYYVGQTCRARLKKENLKDWLICKEPDTKCLRYALWQNL